MRAFGISRTAMRFSAAGRRHLTRWLVPAVLLSAIGLPVLADWLIGPGPVGEGATLGMLAAGWWGLGLVPVHSDRNLTGPARRPRPAEHPAREPVPQD